MKLDERLIINRELELKSQYINSKRVICDDLHKFHMTALFLLISLECKSMQLMPLILFRFAAVLFDDENDDDNDDNTIVY